MLSISFDNKVAEASDPQNERCDRHQDQKGTDALIVVSAGSIASFLDSRPEWIVWQRRITGALLGVVAILLAREVPARAFI